MGKCTDIYILTFINLGFLSHIIQTQFLNSKKKKYNEIKCKADTI